MRIRRFDGARAAYSMTLLTGTPALPLATALVYFHLMSLTGSASIGQSSIRAPAHFASVCIYLQQASFCHPL